MNASPPPEVRRLTLTFDNGPIPGNTERILDALAQRDLSATFFMVGERVLAPGGRATAERVREAGQRIGNHTMSHGAPLGELDDPEVMLREIREADAVLGDLVGPDRLFRPNGGGRLGAHVLSWVAIDELISGRHTVVTWNCVPREREEGWFARAEAALEELDWTVLVLHDHHAHTVDQLPRLLDNALARGIEVTSELPDDCILLRDGRPQPALTELMGPRPAGAGS